jgi:hypothetical protein
MSSISDRLRRAHPQSDEGALRHEAADEITRLTARVEELEAALKPLACTCAAESQDECSRSEKHCPFWNARAALTQPAEEDTND